MAITVSRVQELKNFSRILQYTFQSLDLLNTALTHSSAVRDAKAQDQDNERLEFLGDAVLKIVISEYLYKRFSDQDEGYLTKLRATLISDATLAELASVFNLGKFLVLSKNEKQSGGTTKKSIVANALEAIFGACYLDGGLTVARDIILRLYEPLLSAGDIAEPHDFKSLLQEKVQGLGWKLPEYRVIQERGPEHEKVFTIQVKVGKGLKNYKQDGNGRTKKEAEQQAAEKLLQILTAQ
jgi:ribonuclease-3